MPIDFHLKKIPTTGVILHLIERIINTFVFLRYVLNIHEKMQRGHPFNFSGGGYGFYPLINFQHITWKTFYTPISSEGAILIYPSLSVYRVYSSSG